MKKNNLLGIIITMISLFSCSNDESSIDIYCNSSVEFTTQKVNYSDFDFTIDGRRKLFQVEILNLKMLDPPIATLKIIRANYSYSKEK